MNSVHIKLFRDIGLASQIPKPRRRRLRLIHVVAIAALVAGFVIGRGKPAATPNLQTPAAMAGAFFRAAPTGLLSATPHGPPARGYRDASVYHSRYAGRRTALGEIYDPAVPSAASNDWPLGTWVTVRRGDRAVRVQVNDRMARRFSGRRIDLSRVAMQRLAPQWDGRDSTAPLLRGVVVEVSNLMSQNGFVGGENEG